MLGNVNMLYLGCSVLVQLDRSYLQRFWTNYEAWLSFVMPSADGLVGATGGASRVTIECLHGTLPKWAEALREELGSATAERAHAYLKDASIQVTNQSDKELQLPKIRTFDQAVMQHMRREASAAGRASSRPGGGGGAGQQPLPSPAGAAPALGLLQQVQLIKESLELDPALPPPSAIKQANEMMGIPPQGSLPEQADTLLKALGA